MKLLPIFARVGARLAIALLIAPLIGALPAAAAGNSVDSIFAALRTPGHFIIMRHALAPGTGDPAGFQPNDCASQRNLSEAGRRQAQRIGDALRSGGLGSAKVLSSEWCRCLETARLLGLGEVARLTSLNSFFDEPNRAREQIRQLRQDIAAMDLSKPAVLVTHQVVISALASEMTASGEMIVMRRTASNELTVVGSLPAPAAN